MKKSHNAIDGFGVVRRRPAEGSAALSQAKSKPSQRLVTNMVPPSAHRKITSPAAEPATHGSVSKSEIAESLNNIDAHAPKQKKPRRKLRPKKIIKWVLIGLLIIGILVGGFLAWRFIANGNKIFKGNVFDIFQQQAKLAEDSNGWTNILVLGTSDDDPNHQGNDLTDSMQIISLNQTTKKVVMYSVPRDLWVEYGQACPAGYQGKINAYYSCVGGLAPGNTTEQNQAAIEKVNKLVGGIYGVTIHYGANVNAVVIRDLVNAVGGKITVDVQGSGGARGVLDSNFDWKCGPNYYQRAQKCPPNGHFIDYTNGIQEMDAEHALYFAQARGDAAPTYGLAAGNFDREANQRKVALAIREKALSAGTLADVGKVTALLNSMGDNIRTTIPIKDISALVNIMKTADTNNIQTIPNLQEAGIFTTGNISGQSSVFPAAGTFDYSDLQRYIQRKISSNPVTQEGALVAVLNGSSVSGVAKTVADRLESSSEKYAISTISNAPVGEYQKYTIYSIGDVAKFSATVRNLKDKFGVAEITQAPAGLSVASGTNFVIVVGDGAPETLSQTTETTE